MCIIYSSENKGIKYRENSILRQSIMKGIANQLARPNVSI